MLFQENLCACRSCARWFHRSCFVGLNAISSHRDLINTSSTIMHSRRLFNLFTPCGVILHCNRYKVRIVPYIAELLQMLGLAFFGLFVQLSKSLVLARFLPAPGFCESRVSVSDYLSFLDFFSRASLLSLLLSQPYT